MTVSEHGWAGLSNGELLRRAEEEFEVLVTGDQSIEYQQNISSGEIGVVVVQAPWNRLEDFRPLAGTIASAIEEIGSEEILSVSECFASESLSPLCPPGGRVADADRSRDDGRIRQRR